MCEAHPTERHLSAYASGAASAGVSLAVSAHLTYCPACRARVAMREAMAAALMAEDSPPPPLDAALARLDDPAPAAPACQAGPLPRPVADAVGVDFDAIPWKFRLPGVHEYAFAGEDGEEISLLRVRPGTAIPQHTHKGEELTVVFDGELLDADKRYGIGDISVADPTVDHHPRAGGDRTCICLAVLGGGLTFTGPFGRALNLFSRG